MRWKLGLRGFLAIVLGLGLAACAPAERVSIRNAEFRPPIGSSGIGAAYFTIRSATPDRIVAISSSEADAVEIHSTVTERGIMSMKRVEAVPLPAGQTVSFAPGGLHVMVFSPRMSRDESSFPITIELESGIKKTVAFRTLETGAGQRS
jgi:copper(I)-binding protein